MSLPFSLDLSFSFCRISIYLVHSLSISRSFYLSLSLCRISIYLSISRSFSFFLSIESLSISLYLVHSPSISIFLHYLFLSISNTNCNSVPNLFSIPSLSGYLLRTFKVSKVSVWLLIWRYTFPPIQCIPSVVVCVRILLSHFIMFVTYLWTWVLQIMYPRYRKDKISEKEAGNGIFFKTLFLFQKEIRGTYQGRYISR